jgi:hypothetical protein
MKPSRICLLSILALALMFAIPRVARTEATPLPMTDHEKEQFLQTAKIGKTKRLPVGVTGSLRATLDDGVLTHDAHIQTVNVFKHFQETPRGVELNFHDSYRYNIAAYRLDRLIGLHMVPVSVERAIDRKKGSVTWWVDDVQMMELTRVQKRIVPPDAAEWNDQMYQMRVFMQLVANNDLNQGNVLITNDWKIRLVDFTRAFRTNNELREPAQLVRIDRRLYEGLQRLDRNTLETELGDLLSEAEIRALLERRDQIVAHFDAQARQMGEATVFCDRSSTDVGR